ncbi:hypothetical protein [Streptococcus anginosus]|uniref:hypothetical protein n=1 Tax=Streptococcus anginosus TaxID=1328 RepID=UPI002EDB1F3D
MRIIIGGDFAIGWETDWKKGKERKNALFLEMVADALYFSAGKGFPLSPEPPHPLLR